MIKNISCFATKKVGFSLLSPLGSLEKIPSFILRVYCLRLEISRKLEPKRDLLNILHRLAMPQMIHLLPEAEVLNLKHFLSEYIVSSLHAN